MLNQNNANHTKEFAYIRLINTYTYKLDFFDAYNTGKDAIMQYPDNKGIGTALRDAGLWAFYIYYNKLDPSYLSPVLKNEYVVKNIDEEYLILRTR